MQTSAAAAIIRRRRAMATAVLYSPRVGAASGELRGATPSSTVPEQCKLVRNKFGLVLGLRDGCGRETVTFEAARRRPEALKPNDADARPARFFERWTRRREGFGLSTTRPGCSRGLGR